jgi:hypothetical protein
MIHFHVGTDTYGRVKTVSGMAIVTKFFMLQMVPLYPLKSYYVSGAASTKQPGIAVLAGFHSATVTGIPLQALDKTSVFMAYARGFFGTLLFAGFLVIVPGIMYLTGEHLDEFALAATRGLIIALITGVAGGALTYVVPTLGPREKRIRAYCAEVFGLAFDPARIEANDRAAIQLLVKAAQQTEDNSRTALLYRLVEVRTGISDESDNQRVEVETDQLLESLRRIG